MSLKSWVNALSIFLAAILPVASLAETLPMPALKNPVNLNRKFWVNIGLGVGGTKSVSGSTFPNYAGVAGEVSINYRFAYHWLVTARSTHVSDYTYFNRKTTRCSLSGIIPCTHQHDWAGDLGGLVGYVFQGDYGYSSLALGLGVAQGRTISNSQRQSFNLISMPVESQVFWTPSGYLGLGVIAFGNINSSRCFGGAVLALQVGTHQITSGDL